MAFVHLHNHCDFSILDASTRIADMVDRAVELGMPAIALTDHGYMFGIPNFDLECRKHNEGLPVLRQWQSDRAAFLKGQTPAEPAPDAPDAGRFERAHGQWQLDMQVWRQSHDVAALDAVRPQPKIKPIFGCEAYFITDDYIEKKAPQVRYHLILLAKNDTGYHNLMKMMSQAATENYYYRPRTTLDMLKKYHEGIICQSACVQGIIQRNILAGDLEAAERWALEYKAIFGDDFYMEIQEHGNTFENGYTDRTLDEELVKLARKLDIKVVATNDIHYLLREDAPTQEVVNCIGKAAQIGDGQHMSMQGSEYYFKTEDEMRQLFAWCPEACDNTLEVAAKCNYELDWSHMYLPKFPDLEPGETSEQRFRTECERGLARRYGDDWRHVQIAGINVEQRFEYEYKVICEKGFADYFLIVQEYVRWAKDNGIGVGPGRGSAAGAIVAYAMDITTFDPLENGLLFERFLSVERSEMPDIDMDFDDERRLEVVQHVRELYGADHVCHVITYSTIKAKQAINDAARVLGYPPYLAQKLSKMISSAPDTRLDWALHQNEKHPDHFSPDFVDAYKNDEDSRKIIDSALSIEGLTRGEGVHACAVLITPTPVTDHVPTKIDTKGGVEITQYEGHSVADMGLLKMDFLGLRTLTVISKAKASIKQRHGTIIDVDAIPFDDPAIFKLMADGRTAGVFQIESGGMTATIKGMRPREYKHVVALIALYRPGPLGAGMVEDYIDRMNGKKEVAFYDPRLAEILEETYGTIVYQEQVMQISMKMSGFSAGESDSRIRKPVAKKKIKLLTDTVFTWDDGAEETTYDHWMNGAERNGYSRDVAQKIWDDVLEFASYAFNKSHSAGYAILVMQTAWLKAHYPKEYMAAVLTSYMGKTDKITHYINACKDEGIKILPPDVNESGRDFTATDAGIRFGFAGIKGVGVGVGEAIMAEREANGPFTSLHDFVGRMPARLYNKKTIEVLIKAGAFDATGYTRRQMMLFLERDGLLEQASQKQKAAEMGQVSMFDMLDDDDAEAGFVQDIPEPDGVEWDRRVKLDAEKEVLGMYISDHPLAPYQATLNMVSQFKISDLADAGGADEFEGFDGMAQIRIPTDRDITVAGMVVDLQYKITKRGDRMAVFSLESMDGSIECVVFPKMMAKCNEVLREEAIVKVHGRYDSSDRGVQLKVSHIEQLDFTKRLTVQIAREHLDKLTLDTISSECRKFPGTDQLSFTIADGAGARFCIDVPARVDSGNIVLKSSLASLLKGKGRVLA